MRPRVCVVGPLLGGNAGTVPSQGEVLAAHLGREGYEVTETSHRRGKFMRFFDTVWCMVRWRRDVDVFVVMVFSGPSFVMAEIAVAVARVLRRPVVLHLHGGNLPTFAARRMRWLLRSAADLVAPSPYLSRALGGIAGAVREIPNVLTIDTDAAAPERTGPIRPCILWMRTFHAEYQPELAVEAVRRVREVRPDVELTMAGQDSGARAAVEALVARHGLEGVVGFPGFLGPDAKRDALRSHDVFLNTNLVDNSPVSVLEAAWSGLAIVATAVGGIPDLLVDGESALLVPATNADDVAAALLRVIDEPELAARLRAGARRVAERSTWPAVAAQWDEVLRGARR